MVVCKYVLLIRHAYNSQRLIVECVNSAGKIVKNHCEGRFVFFLFTSLKFRLVLRRISI